MRLLILYEATMAQIERRVPIFMQKYFRDDQSPETLKIIEQLAEIDPTNGKYTEWLIRQHITKTIRLPEDAEKLERNLKKFHKVKSKLPERDINKYTPGDLAKALEQVGSDSKRQEKKLGRQGKMALPQGAELVMDTVRYNSSGYSQGGHKVVKITDSKASSILCSGTEWCVANAGTADEYLEDGPLYLIYVNGERECLVHLETAQFMDIYDEPLDSWDALKFIDFLEPVTNKTIYTEPNLAMWFIQNFEPTKGDKLTRLESVIAKDATIALDYARNLRNPSGLGYRWPEAEPYIMKDPAAALNYAQSIIRGRWPEAEPYIMKDPAAALNYAQSIIKGRWLEAEPYIMKDPNMARWYAANVISGRWPEAEPYIMKDPEIGSWYKKFLLRIPLLPKA